MKKFFLVPTLLQQLTINIANPCKICLKQNEDYSKLHLIEPAKLIHAIQLDTPIIKILRQFMQIFVNNQEKARETSTHVVLL